MTSGGLAVLRGSVRISLIQLAVHDDEPLSERVRRVGDLVRAQRGADLVVLPELWPHGAFAYQRWATEAETLDDPTVYAMSAAARDLGGWLHAGSLIERASDLQLYNCSVLLDPHGDIAATYRKIHRFGFTEGEAKLISAGEEPVTYTAPFGTLGFAICYDLRFPELFRLLVDRGAEILVIPAGWPARRVAHWRLLLQARAVECQAYVLGCATAGEHCEVRMSGHSMVVDPWGEIVAEAGEDEEVLTVEIDPARVAEVRRDFPVLRDRRLGLPAPQLAD